MKIDELTQNSTSPYVGNARAERPEAADAHAEAVAKPQAATDKVELSSYQPQIPASVEGQDFRAGKVREIRSRLDSGNYQVPSSAVAEKMFSRLISGTGQAAVQ